jgi:hypothetical protein
LQKLGINNAANSSAPEIDEIKIALIQFFKDKDNNNTLVKIRKINTNSYLVICSTMSEAKKIVGYETNNKFKLRYLNDSPSDIK